MNAPANDQETLPVQAPRAVAPVETAPFRRQLVLGNAAVLVLVGILAILTLYQSRREYVRQAEAVTSYSARLLARNMAGIVEKTDVALASVVVQSRKQTDSTAFEALGLNEQLASLQPLTPELASLRVADRQGVLRFGTRTGSAGGVSIADRDHFVRARDNKDSGLILNGPVVSRITDKRSMLLARRLEAADGSFAGVVVAAIETEYLRNLFAAAELGDLGSVSLLTRDLRLITRYPTDGEAVADSGDSLSSQLREMLRRSPDGGTYTAINAADGTAWKSSYIKVADYPLYIVAGVSQEKYLAGWYGDVLRIAGVVVLILLVSLGSSWGLYRHWIRQQRASAALQKESYRNKVLLHTANDGIHVLDRRGRLVDVNPAFCSTLGYSRDELIGRNIAHIDKGQCEHHKFSIGRDALVGRLVFETRYQCKDGSFIDVEVSATGLDVEGRHLVFAFVRDISARKHAEAERQRLHRTLELVSESNTALLHAEQEETLLPHICQLIVERGGYRMAWVGFAETDKERSVRPVASSGYEDGYLESITVSWGDNELGRGPTGTAIRTGKTFVNQNVLTNVRMGPWREAAIRHGYSSSIGLPLISDGVVVGALTIYAAEPHAFAPDEIRLLEKLASNLAFGIDSLRAKMRLITLNQELQAFTYASSHDLKTPLRAISSFSELLCLRYKERLEGEGLLFLEQINQGAARMTALIDNLLAYAKVEQGINKLEPVDFRNALEGVLAERQEDLLRVKLEAAVPAVRVRANPCALVLVLRNLLDNALLYSGSSCPAEIEIGGEAADGICRIWVRDNGIGFDMAYHDRIFEIFRRLHTYEEYPGTGIGLALVKRAMEGMGGQVWATSRPGQGATFFIELMTEALPMTMPAPKLQAESLLPH